LQAHDHELLFVGKFDELAGEFLVEKIAGDAGAEVKFDEVLMVGGTEAPKVGKPTVSGAKVTGQIVRQTKARRVVHFRKEKEGWTRMRGHRQPFTEIKITGVSA
jgi:large subunit ribosomal protein L21